MITVNRMPLIVAHRGASFDAPENTLAAFRLGWEQHADAIEGDFHLTRDGHIVCCHDETMKRTAGVDRAVASMALAELQTLDVGRWKHTSFGGERVATLGEVLALVPADKFILVEIKCGPEIMPALREELSQRSPANVRLISFNAEVIAAVKRELPRFKAYWLAEFEDDKATDKSRPTLEEILATLDRVKADGLDVERRQDIVDETFVAALRARGYELHVWTVDDPDDARRLAELGVDSITTNKPGMIREALRR